MLSLCNLSLAQFQVHVLRDVQLRYADPRSQTLARVVSALMHGGKASMFIVLGIVLLILWAGGFFVFHAAGFLIHILVLLAIVSFVFQFLRGR